MLSHLNKSIERQRLLCEDSGNQDPTLRHLQETYIKFKNLHKNGPSKKKKKIWKRNVILSSVKIILRWVVQ